MIGDSSVLRIDPATEKDVPAMLRMIEALAEYERLTYAVVATEAHLIETMFGARPEAEAIIARLGGEAVGFALWFHNYSTFLGRRGLYLEDLFVLPERRGQGIGKALLSHLARIAVARGCARMDWLVLDWNETAIRFYKGLGAQPLDEWTTFRLSGDALKRAAETGNDKA